MPRTLAAFYVASAVFFDIFVNVGDEVTSL